MSEAFHFRYLGTKLSKHNCRIKRPHQYTPFDTIQKAIPTGSSLEGISIFYSYSIDTALPTSRHFSSLHINFNHCKSLSQRRHSICHLQKYSIFSMKIKPNINSCNKSACTYWSINSTNLFTNKHFECSAETYGTMKLCFKSRCSINKL